MAAWELAQFNVAELAAPLDSPALAEFVANLDQVNALAEAAPGFVWRLKGEGSSAVDLRPLGERVLVNMSVWRDLPSLRAYVYRSQHGQFLRRRREWFLEPAALALVLWWTPGGMIPEVGEGLRRLELLRREGPTPEAFTFSASFPPP